MAQRPNLNSRIPGIPKPLLRHAISTLTSNPSSSSGNMCFKNIRAANLRRSKSLTDISSFKAKPIAGINKINTTTMKKAIKRPALTESNPVTNKISKVTKPEPTKCSSKPVQPKIAPYDYKGRYNHLKEIHDKLKIAHRELKEQHEIIADQHEDFLAKTNQLQNDLNLLNKSHENLKSLYEKLTEQHSSAAERIDTLQTKSDKLETELKNKSERLEITTKDLKETKENFNNAQSKLSVAEKQLEETLELNTFMKKELYSLQNEKRIMHNTIQELKGNIRVFCRVRPSLPSEQERLLYDVNYLDETSIEMYRTKDKKLEFVFDKVFGPSSSQQVVYEELSQLVQSALDGYNVCVFAYGQTGSGKTYTMEGGFEQESRGMIPRSIDTIFNALESMKKLGWTYNIKASFLEIYNEVINDLLDPKNTNLDIKMCDAKGTDVYVANLTVEDIDSPKKLKTLIRTAQKNRAVAATENNERSSRSHSVAKISLEGINAEQGQQVRGNLNLVDLAGSEKFHTTETTRLRETTNINKSLSNLSNVILGLVKKNSHIPYRNSKLTYLLMPSLGGNSKTLMLVNISPLDDCFNESVNSLRFASTVNQCKTGSIRKQKTQA